MEPLISINLTTYNRVSLLSRSIDSILEQSYTRVEIIIVDDASTDNTEMLVNAYQAKNSTIKYIRHSTNQGLAVARNTGIANSSGDLIAFMDDDDKWIDKDKLKKQVSVFQLWQSTHPLAFVCSGVRLFSSGDTYTDKIITMPKNLKLAILAGNGFIYSPTVVFDKSLLVKIGGFDENLKKGVDSELYRRAILKHKLKIIIMPDITTAIYEYGGDRITSNLSNKKIISSIHSHCLNICKYSKHFVIYPKVLFQRLLSIIRLIALLRIKKF